MEPDSVAFRDVALDDVCGEQRIVPDARSFFKALPELRCSHIPMGLFRKEVRLLGVLSDVGRLMHRTVRPEMIDSERPAC